MSCKIRIKKKKYALDENLNEEFNLNGIPNNIIHKIFGEDISNKCIALENAFNTFINNKHLTLSCTLKSEDNAIPVVDSSNLAEEDQDTAADAKKAYLYFINAISGTLAEDIFECFSKNGSKFEGTFERRRSKNRAPDFYWKLNINGNILIIPFDIKSSKNGICKGSLRAGNTINDEIAKLKNIKEKTNNFNTFDIFTKEFTYINQLLFIIDFSDSIINGCKIVPLVICLPEEMPGKSASFKLKIKNNDDINKIKDLMKNTTEKLN